jgi:ABC-2 type transport system permease protein
MRHVLTIGWNDFRRVVRQREALFWIFVGPLVFTVFFGLLFAPQPERAQHLALVNQDQDDRIAGDLERLLSQDKLVVDRAAAVAPGRLTLVVSPGTGAALAAGQAVKLVLHADRDESPAERNARFKIQKALFNVYFLQGGTPGATSPAGPLVIERLDIGVPRREVTAGFQRSVPAYLVMFVFLNLLVSGADVAEERASGRLKRIAIAPVSRHAIVLGKLLSRFATGWLQIAYMLALGLVFHIRWAAHPWVFLLFLSLFALATASAGLLMGTLFRDPDKCRTIAIWAAVLLSPLGGLWWPLEVVGPTMRQLAYVVPTGWAMEGVNSMLAFGAGFWDVAPFGLAFLALFAVTFPLAARRLNP